MSLLTTKEEEITLKKQAEREFTSKIKNDFVREIGYEVNKRKIHNLENSSTRFNLASTKATTYSKYGEVHSYRYKEAYGKVTKKEIYSKPTLMFTTIWKLDGVRKSFYTHTRIEDYLLTQYDTTILENWIQALFLKSFKTVIESRELWIKIGKYALVD